MSFHSFGQYWLTSWGYKTELPVDNEKLVKCYLLYCVDITPHIIDPGFR